MTYFITETHIAPINVMSQNNILGLIAILPDKVFQQCQDLIVQSLEEGFCRVQQREHIFKSISFSTLRSTVANSWKEKILLYKKELHQNTKQKARQKRKTANEE